MFLQTRHPDCDNEGYWRHPVGAAPILLLAGAGDTQPLPPGSEQTLHHLAAEILPILTWMYNYCEALARVRQGSARDGP